MFTYMNIFFSSFFSNKIKLSEVFFQVELAQLVAPTVEVQDS